MKKLKLTKISLKNCELIDEEKRKIFGGYSGGCCCGCLYYYRGGSGDGANLNANSAHGLHSPGC